MRRNCCVSFSPLPQGPPSLLFFAGINCGNVTKGDGDRQSEERRGSGFLFLKVGLGRRRQKLAFKSRTRTDFVQRPAALMKNKI